LDATLTPFAFIAFICTEYVDPVANLDTTIGLSADTDVRNVHLTSPFVEYL
jgi:hypothetical protein